MLGHFRHEIGHYYWDRLIKDTPGSSAFASCSATRRVDYDEALERHYETGRRPTGGDASSAPTPSMHPWEDWAETWAHYLHMVDTLETARSYGLALRPKPATARAAPVVDARAIDFDDFDDLIAAWVPLTLALNSLNRSMGLPTCIRSCSAEPALEKLRFVHDVVEASRAKAQGSGGDDRPLEGTTGRAEKVAETPSSLGR